MDRRHALRSLGLVGLASVAPGCSTLDALGSPDEVENTDRLEMRFAEMATGPEGSQTVATIIENVSSNSVQMDSYRLSFDSGQSRRITLILEPGAGLRLTPGEGTGIGAQESSPPTYMSSLGSSENPFDDGYAVAELFDKSGDLLIREIYDQ